MTEYIKRGSDRPDVEITIRDLDGRAVDLRSADAVQITVWVGFTKLIDEPATIDAARFGIVTYDVQRADVDLSGDALVELRVEWDDGDHQWFPIDERGYELTIVPSPGPRDGQPLTGNGILRVADGETHDVDGTETYARVEDGGTVRTGGTDVLRT